MSLSEEITKPDSVKRAELASIRSEQAQLSDDATDLISDQTVIRKLHDLDDVIEKMKTNCINACDLGIDLNDIDAYNAVANILKKTADAHVGFIKLIEAYNCKDGSILEGGNDISNQIPQRSLSDLNNIIQTRIKETGKKAAKNKKAKADEKA